MARLAQGTVPFWRGEADDGPSAVTYQRGQVLVLMPMADVESDSKFRAIKAASATVGLSATRVDEGVGSRIIMRDLDKMMGEAEFLVFDLSDGRPNVYYELGYAHGIGNHAGNVLLIARDGTRLHFDIAPLRVHFFRSTDQLQALVSDQLAKLKRGTEHSPAHSVSLTRPWWKFW